MGIIAWLVVGAIGGWLASFLVKVPIGGLLGNIVAGVLGGLVAGWLGGVIFGGQDFMTGINLTSIITSFIGAILVSAVAGFIFKGRG